MNCYEPIIEVNPFRGSHPEEVVTITTVRYVLTILWLETFGYLKSTDLIIASRSISNVRSEDIKFETCRALDRVVIFVISLFCLKPEGVLSESASSSPELDKMNSP